MITGVGLLLFLWIEGNPRLFVVKELKDKPEICKKAGMLSFPLETYKDSDGNYAGTINRLIKEEIGISPDLVEVRGLHYQHLKLIPGRNDVNTVYGYGWYLGGNLTDFRPTDTDILFEGWFTCGELIAQPHIRVEVRPIISHFVRHATL